MTFQVSLPRLCSKYPANYTGFETFGARFGSDISLLTGNHKKYLYGPGSILSAHKPDEFLMKIDLINAVEGYKTIVRFNLNG